MAGFPTRPLTLRDVPGYQSFAQTFPPDPVRIFSVMKHPCKPSGLNFTFVNLDADWTTLPCGCSIITAPTEEIRFYKQLMDLPAEILEMIFRLALPSKSGADLKELRLMNKTLATFVTQYLFRWICLSRAAENFQAWKGITEGELGGHVEHVCIDSTTFIDEITESEYSTRLAEHLTKHLLVQGLRNVRNTAETYTRENLFSDMHLERRTKLMPGDKKLLWNGYNEYLWHAKSQKEAGCDDLYKALILGLPSLPRVKGFSFITQWPVHIPPLKSSGLDGRCTLWEGGIFIFPGPIARKHLPLRLSPQCTRSWTAKDGTSVRTDDFLAVLRAVSHLNMDLRTLLYPDLSGDSRFSSYPVWSGSLSSEVSLPMEAFTVMEQLQNHNTIEEVVTKTPNPVRNLERLDLTISPPLLETGGFTHSYMSPRGASYITEFLLSMPNLESLVLRQNRRESDGIGIGLLRHVFGTKQRIFPFPPPLPNHIRSLLPSLTFQYTFGPQHTMCVMNGPLYPKLKHLELDGFENTGCTLISLVERVAVTLESLTLRNIETYTGSQDWVTWKHVLEALRVIFASRTPPLNLSLTFSKDTYVKLVQELFDFGNYRFWILEEDEWIHETGHPNLQTIENHVTSKYIWHYYRPESEGGADGG